MHNLELKYETAKNDRGLGTVCLLFNFIPSANIDIQGTDQEFQESRFIQSYKYFDNIFDKAMESIEDFTGLKRRNYAGFQDNQWLNQKDQWVNQDDRWVNQEGHWVQKPGPTNVNRLDGGIGETIIVILVLLSLPVVLVVGWLFAGSFCILHQPPAWCDFLG